MSRPSPTPFETDMAMVGLQAGRHPIPKSVTSRPEPGEYGGMYDEKAASPPSQGSSPPSASPPPEEKTSEPEHADAKKGGYKTRQVTKDAEGKEWG